MTCAHCGDEIEPRISNVIEVVFRMPDGKSESTTFDGFGCLGLWLTANAEKAEREFKALLAKRPGHA